MSDLFMDMHHRRLNRAAALRSAASFGSDTSSAANGNSSTVSSFYANGVNSFAENGTAEEEETDQLSNMLNLKLKKPKHWKWELSTSRSCSNIALPRILLYDHLGNLLVDANTQDEKVYRHDELKKQRRAERRRSTKAATTNLEQSIRKALDNEFNELQIQEATPSLSPEPRGRYSMSRSATSSAIDFNTNDLPNYERDSRSSSLKGVRFNVIDEIKDSNPSFPIANLPTPPSTTTTGTSTSSGPRQKRRYRRSRSSGRSSGPASESILERFSFNRGRFSSPEFAEEHEVYHPPRYFLRTSKAGTLVVQDESFRSCRRRRKLKNSSSENLRNGQSSRSQSTNSLKVTNSTSKYLKAISNEYEPRAGSLQNITEQRERMKRVHPVRRYKSDGNVLLHRQLSTSEEENAELEKEKRYKQGGANVKDSKYSSFRKQSKTNLVSIDAGNGVLSTRDNPTAR